MSGLLALVRDRRGAAAAEMALVTPMLVLLMFGSAELGNYFMDQHILVKAVRDGARYAARQGFENFATCDAAPGGAVVADTKNVIGTGRVSGGAERIPRWSEVTLVITTRCATGPSGTTYAGIYTGMTGGARYVEVSASVPYRPVLDLYGLQSSGLTLNATQQAAVAGI